MSEIQLHWILQHFQFVWNNHKTTALQWPLSDWSRSLHSLQGLSLQVKTSSIYKTSKSLMKYLHSFCYLHCLALILTASRWLIYWYNRYIPNRIHCKSYPKMYQLSLLGVRTMDFGFLGFAVCTHSQWWTYNRNRFL